MPPRDPRHRPALEYAMPGNDDPGSYVVLDWPEPIEVPFGETGEDGKPVRRIVRVRCRARDLDGRETILAEWYAEGSTWQEWYRVEAGEPES